VTTGTAEQARHDREIAERGARELEDASAEEIVRWAFEHVDGKIAVASNMQDAVLIDVVTNVQPDIDVVFLDTGYHFAETLGVRDAASLVYPEIRIVNFTPDHTVAEQDEALGKDLFADNPGECCRLRKVEPLAKGLAGYRAWITGIRRAESPTRANAPKVAYDDAFGLVKFNPIVTWSDEEFAEYAARNSVLVNPLVEEGYPSIGCAPCTRKPLPGSDPRSGRWAGFNKTECGLHQG
jgi:phosphoadenosine phosphosulfate reductase